MMVNKKIRQSLNKAFLKVKLLRQDINKFKDNLEILLKITDKEINEKEEFHKNNLTTFLKDTYYSTNHYINTQDNNDLVIYNGKNINSKIGVIIETKRPHNTREMITSNKFNCKALQQLLFYYLRERITNKNFKIKHLIITNIYDWFVFRGDLFERLFYQDKFLVKQFNDFQEKRLTSEKTKLFYEEIAFNAINKVELELKENCVNFNLKDYEKEEDFSLTLLYKFLSPQHLLKLPFANDSNSLDQGFYS
ncbi:MAG: class I SAM-dependent DNA methyltransferase, partial [Cyanobacteria bacterium]|nr:class I SAM-dependent DNA methyltransferase [Cyanobacteria bacterium CG_2015-22_32_23]